MFTNNESNPNSLLLWIWRLVFSYNKPTRCTNFSNLFWKKTLHVSDSFSVHHQEFFTLRTAMVYVIEVCWHILLLCVQWITPDDGQNTDLLTACKQDKDVPSWSCSQAVSKPVWHIHIAVCRVLDSWWWTEELSATCRVLFQEKSWEISPSTWFYYK